MRAHVDQAPTLSIVYYICSAYRLQIPDSISDATQNLCN